MGTRNSAIFKVLFKIIVAVHLVDEVIPHGIGPPHPQQSGDFPAAFFDRTDTPIFSSVSIGFFVEFTCKML